MTSAPSGTSALPAGASSTSRPSRTTRSKAPSIPSRGSRTRAPRTTRPRGRDGGAHEAHAGAFSCSGRSTRAGGCAGHDLVEDGHADDHAGLDLGGDDGLRRVDDLAGELDPAVDRAGVHEHLARVQAAAVDLVLVGVLAQGRHEGLVHALVLHAQGVDDVGLGQVVEGEAHVAAERLDAARDQRRRPADGDPGAHLLEGEDVRARHARVQDVADDPDAQAVERRPGAGAGCGRRAAPAWGARACRRRR